MRQGSMTAVTAKFHHIPYWKMQVVISILWTLQVLHLVLNTRSLNISLSPLMLATERRHPTLVISSRWPALSGTLLSTVHMCHYLCLGVTYQSVHIRALNRQQVTVQECLRLVHRQPMLMFVHKTLWLKEARRVQSVTAIFRGRLHSHLRNSCWLLLFAACHVMLSRSLIGQRLHLRRVLFISSLIA